MHGSDGDGDGGDGDGDGGDGDGDGDGGDGDGDGVVGYGDGVGGYGDGDECDDIGHVIVTAAPILHKEARVLAFCAAPPAESCPAPPRPFPLTHCLVCFYGPMNAEWANEWTNE